MAHEVTALTPAERDLLEWLGREDFSQYGECYGPTLDSLIAKGLVELSRPGEHQSGFIAQDPHGTKSRMYLAVSLTESGRAAKPKM